MESSTAEFVARQIACERLPILHFHGKVNVTPTKCIRLPTLRGFNLSLSKRRCQGQGQNAAWYVACGTPFP